MEGAVYPILNGDFLLLRRFYVLFGLYVYFLSQSERDL